jgi:hypothetical protein
MNMKNRILLSLFLFVFSILAMRNENFAQSKGDEIRECTTSSKKGVKYKLISVGRTIREPGITGLRIAVNKKHFNQDEMVELAAIIKAKYCTAEIISVVIFDDAKVAKQARAVIDQLVGNRKVPELRGFYTFDRPKHVEKISFSRKRGNPTDEVVLTLPLTEKDR